MRWGWGCDGGGEKESHGAAAWSHRVYNSRILIIRHTLKEHVGHGNNTMNMEVTGQPVHSAPARLDPLPSWLLHTQWAIADTPLLSVSPSLCVSRQSLLPTTVLTLHGAPWSPAMGDWAWDRLSASPHWRPSRPANSETAAAHPIIPQGPQLPGDS